MQSLLLIAVALAFFALPLLPAWRELRRPQDNEALEVDNLNPSDALRPLKRAQALVQQLLGNGSDDLAEQLAARGVVRLENDTEGLGGWDAWAQTTRVVLAEGPLTAKPSEAPLSVVHAPVVRAQGILDYVVSAERMVLLSPGCEVRSAHAAQVWAGEPNAPVLPETLFDVGQEPPVSVLPGARWLALQQRWQADKDVSLPAGVCLQGDLVAGGTVVLGAGCLVKGSIKARRVVAQDKALVSGNVVAQSVQLGEGAGIKGCVVCDEELTLGLCAQVGSRQQPSTALATDVVMAQGARVLGSVQAHRSVRVV